MTPAAFVDTLHAKGGSLLLSDDGARVKLRAPAHVVTAHVEAYLRRHKPELLALLRFREDDRLREEQRAAHHGTAPPQAKRHVALVRALLDEARAGRLPIVDMGATPGAGDPSCPAVIDVGALVLDTADLCRVADCLGRTEDAESHAYDLLTLADWWQGIHPKHEQARPPLAPLPPLSRVDVP